MAEKSLAKSGRKEIDKFVEDKSVLDIVDSIMYLDTIKPYVGLSQNGEVGEFLQRRNIPVVHSKSDFDYLYNSLMDKIVKLEGKDERAKTYLQHANYQKQMTELPALMSKLEKTAIKFDVLKEPFKAIMKYVYSIIDEDKIEINNGEINLFKKGEGPEIISISNTCEDNDDVCLIAEYDKKWKNNLQCKLNEFFHIHLYPVYEVIKHEGIEMKKTLFGNREKKVYTKTAELKDVGITMCSYYNERYYDDERSSSTGEFIDYLVKTVKSGKIKRENFLGIIKTLVNLPNIINNNIGKSEERLNNLLSEISGISNK